MSAVTTEASAFFSHFTSQRDRIQSRIDTISNGDDSTITEILKDINVLEKGLTDATLFLPTYDQRQYNLTIKSLNEALQSKKAPKGKFSFKKRPVKSLDPIAIQEPKSISSSTLDLSKLPPETTVGYANNSNERLQLSEQSKPMDLFLVSLQNCIIQGPKTAYSALHIENMSNCILLDTEVQNSVLIRTVSDSVIVLRHCHQLRMHDAKNVIVLLHVPTSPIIEDSSSIRFGQWGPDDSSNRFADVSDFNWLRQQQSPNWSIIDNACKDNLESTLSSITQNTLQDAIDNLPQLLVQT